MRYRARIQQSSRIGILSTAVFIGMYEMCYFDQKGKLEDKEEKRPKAEGQNCMQS